MAVEPPIRASRATTAAFPEIPYPSWRDSLATLHRFAQVVGKIRLAASHRRNHWWNVPFHLTGRGITTRPMGDDPIFTIDFDFLDHRLDITTVSGLRHAFPLVGQSVAGFTAELARGLEAVDVDVAIAHPRPFDLPDAARPFAEDTEHAGYDPAAVTRYWRVLSRVNLLLEEFAGRWSGKTSPVHHFWHTFDIAVTRFGAGRVEHPPTTDPVTREAYSREVISFGFWFGDDSFPEPAFYSYTSPEPDGLADEPLQPAGARWAERNGSHIAVLRYDDARTLPEPRTAVLDFYESAYRAGTRRTGWDLARDDCIGGATDPYAWERHGRPVM
ncbi:DUF5996 family protein [Pseudonocardia acidicola]|uniref:Ava_C0101 and related proteins n=1 Tax=Pseudonocardia acidicola TaxID=2724939 RepID=A0ABX1SFG3_9PSEU|nr:DUF5996 family protein [Pseudonocardia acidicola]NMI00296.1 hypothetical protein [Pseudonocardia acidicola]